MNLQAIFTPTIDLILLLLLLALVLLLLYLWQREFRLGEGSLPKPRVEFPPKEFYVQDEIIVSGSKAIIKQLIDKLAASFGKEVNLTELDSDTPLEFGALLGNVPEICTHIPRDLVVVKYKIEGKKPNVLAVIRWIDQALGNEPGQISREPNWIAGQPWEIEGSPWEIEGSPWEIEGSAVPRTPGLPDVQVTSIAPGLFMKQWAFDEIGLGDDQAIRKVSGMEIVPTGKGVVVGILDSSPFKVGNANLYEDKIVPLSGVVKDMILHVTHVEATGGALPAANCPTSAVRNHGLFVAGLIHAVAPDSEKYLYKVLDDCNRGDLYLLIKGLYLFLSEVVSKKAQGKAVINMSLVVRIPPGEARFGLPTDLFALNYALEVANCLDVVAISAAGNGSAKATIPWPASLPAGMSGVIAVAANNIVQERSCFSNCGEVGAPGGDGRPVADDRCKPSFADCPDVNDHCKTAVIGPAIRPDFSNERDIQFVCWVGSSFSAPLVSGLAALVVQCGGGAFSPSVVRRYIFCGANQTDEYALGMGVINIPWTLSLCAAAASGGPGTNPAAAAGGSP